MTTDFKFAIAALALAVVLAGAAEPGEPIGPRMEDGSFGNEPATPGTGTPGDDDPTIYEWEVVAPGMDSRNASWEPGYKWFDDPRTLNCEGRRACEDYKAVEVAKAESQTSSGAPR